jgi:hypothetical protein
MRNTFVYQERGGVPWRSYLPGAARAGHWTPSQWISRTAVRTYRIRWAKLKPDTQAFSSIQTILNRKQVPEFVNYVEADFSDCSELKEMSGYSW